MGGDEAKAETQREISTYRFDESLGVFPHLPRPLPPEYCMVDAMEKQQYFFNEHPKSPHHSHV
jgi:hypothetical protein